MESKQYRIKVLFIDDINNKKWEVKSEMREEITENDVINTLCYKYLDKVKKEDIRDYKELLSKVDKIENHRKSGKESTIK